MRESPSRAMARHEYRGPPDIRTCQHSEQRRAIRWPAVLRTRLSSTSDQPQPHRLMPTYPPEMHPVLPKQAADQSNRSWLDGATFLLLPRPLAPVVRFAIDPAQMHRWAIESSSL